MYLEIKNSITKIVPRKLLFQQEETLRKLFSIFYSGTTYQCSVCNKNLNRFITTIHHDRLCPNCGSLERNRRLWLLLEREFLIPNSSILDFSPSRCLYRKLKKIKDINKNIFRNQKIFDSLILSINTVKIETMTQKNN